MPTKPKHKTSEMSIGRQTSRPSLRPWQVVLKWHECLDGSLISHDYRWKISGSLGRDARGPEVWELRVLAPSASEWNGMPVAKFYGESPTVKALMIQAQDYSDGFRRHVWESIHGPWKPTAR